MQTCVDMYLSQISHIYIIFPSQFLFNNLIFIAEYFSSTTRCVCIYMNAFLAMIQTMVMQFSHFNVNLLWFERSPYRECTVHIHVAENPLYKHLNMFNSQLDKSYIRYFVLIVFGGQLHLWGFLPSNDVPIFGTIVEQCVSTTKNISKILKNN